MSKFVSHDADEFVNGGFTGAVTGLANSAYHIMNDSWSSTALKYMYSTSPYHFKAKYIDRTVPFKEPSAQMELGSLVHMYVLTPDDFDKEFVVLPECDLRTKDGKAIKASIEAQACGRTIVTFDQVDVAKKIAGNIVEDKHAYRLLFRTRPEVSYFWQCPFSGLRFRSRIDAVADGYFLELKTTKSASPKEFERHAYNLNYDLSVAHYTEGLRMCGFGERMPCYFIVAETEAPYAVQCFGVSDSFKEVGHQKWLDAVTKLEAGLKNNSWPGYFVGFDEGELPQLNAPRWAINTSMESVD